MEKQIITLRKKKLAKGVESLYLDIYYKGKRRYEFLRLYLRPEKTRADKVENQRTLQLANAVKAQRLVDIQNGIFGFSPQTNGRTTISAYLDHIISSLKERGNVSTSLSWVSFKRHIFTYERNAEKEVGSITPRWINGFTSYLREAKTLTPHPKKLSQNTAVAYQEKMSAFLNKCLKDGLLENSQMADIEKLPKEDARRNYLSLEEVQAFSNVECRTEREEEVRKAFLFSCLCGLRISDIVALNWGDLYEENGYTRIIFKQKKTRSQEYLDLSPQARDIIGNLGNPEEAVFPLLRATSTTYINKVVKNLSERSGIRKHVTFHVARHTFATLLLTLGTDIYTVSKLLGHRALTTTQIYAKIVDKKKRDAVESIPRLMKSQK